MSGPITRDATEGTYTPLPDGAFHQRIESAEGRASDDKDQLMVKCAVASGPHNGKAATHWFSLKSTAMWKVRQLLDATGADYQEVETGRLDERGKPITSITFDPELLAGLEFVADCTFDQQYNNNKWLNYRPAPGAAQAQATPAQGAPAGQPGTPVERRRRTVLRA